MKLIERYKKLNGAVKFLIFLCLFASMIYYYRPSDNEVLCHLHKGFLSLSFKRVVVEKFLDKKQHSYPTIIVRSIETGELSQFNLTRDTSSLFESLNKLDTISKTLNSDEVYLKVKGQFKEFKKVDFGCSEKNGN